jgi:NAD(P)-dependent dehydrogenase (short-subunit alcohol dehydrogenase family)
MDLKFLPLQGGGWSISFDEMDRVGVCGMIPPRTACRRFDPPFEREGRMEPNMKSVVVTGSSTGIGWGVSKVLVSRGFRVFGSVRKAVDGERLQKAFGPNFVPLIFDVTDAAAVARGAEQVSAALGGETLFGLVNNAGIAVAGPLLYLKSTSSASGEVNLTGAHRHASLRAVRRPTPSRTASPAASS